MERGEPAYLMSDTLLSKPRKLPCHILFYTPRLVLNSSPSHIKPNSPVALPHPLSALYNFIPHLPRPACSRPIPRHIPQLRPSYCYIPRVHPYSLTPRRRMSTRALGKFTVPTHAAIPWPTGKWPRPGFWYCRREVGANLPLHILGVTFNYPWF